MSAARQIFWPAVTRLMFRKVLGHASDRSAGADVEPAALTSADGSKLEGALAAAHGAPRGVLLLCHPFTRHGSGYFLRGGLLPAIREAGWHALLFNFKGFGRSEVRGANFADDVVGAFEYARARFPSLSVAMFGLSFGAFHALAALRRLDGALSGAILDSAPMRASDFFGRTPAGVVLRWLGRSRWAATTGTAPVIDVPGGLRATRLWLVYGDRDEYCELDEIRTAAQRGDQTTLVVLPGFGHLQAFKQLPTPYMKLIGESLADLSAAATPQKKGA